MKDAPFLGLEPHRFGLSDALTDDIELIDALLGTVLGQQETDEVIAIGRALYVQDDEDPLVLLDRHPQLRDVRFVLRLLRAYTVLFQLMNTAEQKEIVRVNRARQVTAGCAP